MDVLTFCRIEIKPWEELKHVRGEKEFAGTKRKDLLYDIMAQNLGKEIYFRCQLLESQLWGENLHRK